MTVPPNVSVKVTVPEDLIDLLTTRVQRKLPGAVRRIAFEAKSFWKSEAGRRLKSARREYQDAIEVEIKAGEASASLLLTGSMLAYMVETGSPGFDMKPGLLKNAKPVDHLKKRYPRAKADTFAPKSITRYRVIPLNVNRYVNMTKPTVFRTVHDQSPPSSWMHPGFKGAKLADEVVRELDTRIIPKHMGKLISEK